MHLRQLERHRKYQITLTLLTIAALFAGLHPEYAHAAPWVGVIANLIWIWE